MQHELMHIICGAFFINLAMKQQFPSYITKRIRAQLFVYYLLIIFVTL